MQPLLNGGAVLSAAPGDAISKTPPPDRKGRVLIVEDQRDARESLELLLSALGYRVDVAADGPEGFHKALRSRPVAAVVDLVLPSGSGFEVARQLRRELGDGVLLVAYNAFGDSIQDHVRQAGFHHHFVKGRDPSELVRWLEARAGRPDG